MVVVLPALVIGLVITSSFASQRFHRGGRSDNSENKSHRGRRAANVHRLNDEGVDTLCAPLDPPSDGRVTCEEDSFSYLCIATCNPGYQFSPGQTTYELECAPEDGIWLTGSSFPACKPICQTACQNGGVCSRPNVCSCNSRDYRGPYCQYSISLCADPPAPQNGQVRCQHGTTSTECHLSCTPGYRPERPAASVYRCSPDGIWNPPKEQIPNCIAEFNIIENTLPTGQPALPTISAVHATVADDATCTAWSQDHYRTFDNKIYTFQGPCTYLLVKDCTYSTFAIHVINDRNCTDLAPCKRELDIYIGSTTITLRRKQNVAEVQWNDQPLTIPTARDGVVFEKLGSYIQVRYGYSFKLKWDSLETVTITVSQDMQNRTCGLCGVYDGNPNNDFQAMSGKLVVSPTSFGTSWKMSVFGEVCADSDQQSSCLVDTPQNRQRSADSNNMCQQLMLGEFSSCHAVVDPAPYIEACKIDCCRSDHDDCMCSTFQAYSRACLQENVGLSWRNTQRCPMSCPAWMVYKECGSSCPRTCGSSSQSCSNDVCIDGCFCPDDMALHNGRCLPLDQCPCTFQGQQYLVSDRVKKDECNYCTCQAGKWICSDNDCSAMCSATGDPHYQTFDGKRYSFMGICSYYLIWHADYEVIVNNYQCGVGEAACTKSVEISFNGQNVKLGQSHQTLVNGKEITQLPYEAHGIKIYFASSLFIKLELSNGLTILWDGRTRAYITAPPSFIDETRGLCGTFNNNQNDDFITREGDIEPNVNLFGNKWKTEDSCQDMASTISTHPCDLNVQRRNKAVEECLKLKSSIFAACHNVVDVDSYYDDCMYDICACQRNLVDCMCPNVGEYADACARKGVQIAWRTQIRECAVKCAGGQVYQVCGNPCKYSCRNIAINPTCQEICVEGCNCPIGETFDDNGECVPIEQCPCIFDGREYRAGFVAFKGDHEICVCSGAEWQCTPKSDTRLAQFDEMENLCPANMIYTDCVSACPLTCLNMHSGGACNTSECRPGCMCQADFVLDGDNCVPAAECPCHHGGHKYYEGEKMKVDCNTCTCQSRKWVCETNECAAVCSSYGDSHHSTFDGRTYEFQGNCDYVLAQAIMTSTVQFMITTENIPCGTSGVTCTKAIDFSIGEPGSLDYHRVQLVRGKPIHLPPDSPFTVEEVGMFIFISTDLGITLMWDKGTRVYIRIDPSFKNQVQGLCGNFNGNQNDDFTMPQGGPPAIRATTFGDSWRVHDYCAPSQEILDTCSIATHRQAWAQQRCGLIQSPMFEPCHNVVPYEPFLDRCIFDACACDLGGDCECLCTAVAAYAHECAVHGLNITWRSQDFCAIQCADCFAYKACVTSCPQPTCEVPQPKCDEVVCVEGCELEACPPGQVYDTTHTPMICIPEVFCNTTMCTINGHGYLEGERITDNSVCNSYCEICFCHNGQIQRNGYCETPTPTPSTSGSSAITGVSTITPRISTPTATLPSTCIRNGWTSWMSSYIPTLQNRGDLEVYANLRKTYSFCAYSQITAIECRLVGTHTMAAYANQVVQCDIREGFSCLHENQLNGLCRDYEIRFECDCGETPTPSVGTSSITPPIITPEMTPPIITPEITPPNITPEITPPNITPERTPPIITPEITPSIITPEITPSATPGQTPTKQTPSTPTRTTGGVSRTPSITPSPETPAPSSSSPTPTSTYATPTKVTYETPTRGSTTTQTSVQGCLQTGWTEWMSTGGPTDEGDLESIPQIRLTRGLCSEDQVKFIECRTVGGHIHNSLTSDVGTVCNTKAGFLCYSTLQPDGSCDDYEIRVYCLCTDIVHECDRPITRETPFLDQSHYTYSSLFEGNPDYHPSSARIGSPSYWRPEVSDRTPSITLDFGETIEFAGLITQGNPVGDEWVTSYTVEISDEQCRRDSFVFIETPTGLTHVFEANTNQHSERKHLFLNTYFGRCLRLTPVHYHTSPALRFEILGCRNPVTNTPVYSPTYTGPSRTPAATPTTELIHTPSTTPPGTVPTTPSTGSSQTRGDEFSSTTMAVPTRITTQVPNPRTTRFVEKQPTTEVESTTTHELTFSETSSSVTKQTPPTRSTAKTPTGSPPTKSTMGPPTSQSSGPTMTPTPSPGTSPSQTPATPTTTGSPSTRGDDTGIITITPPVNSPSGRTTESTMTSTASPGTVSTEKPPFSSTSRTTGKPTSSPSTHNREDVTITPPAISTSGGTGSSSTTTMAVPTKITTQVPDKQTTEYDEVKLTTEVESTTTQELTFSETSSSVTKQTPPTKPTAKTPTGSPPTKSTMVPLTSQSSGPTMTPTPSPGTSPSQTPTATPTTGSPATRGEPEEVRTITPPVNSPSSGTMTPHTGIPTGSPTYTTPSRVTPSRTSAQTATPTLSTVTVPYICREGWSSFMNVDTPDTRRPDEREGPGDYELVPQLHEYYGFCAQPAAIKCRTSTTHQAYHMTGDVGVVCDLIGGGLICVNALQPRGTCQDYEISVLCVCEPSPTVPTSTTPTVTSISTESFASITSRSTASTDTTTQYLECNHGWTEFFNVDNPNNPDGGDFETITRLRKQNRFCATTDIVDIECFIAGTEIPAVEMGQTYFCNIHEGLICLNDEQVNGICLDYAVRFYCQCEDSTPNTPVYSPTYTGPSQTPAATPPTELIHTPSTTPPGTVPTTPSTGSSQTRGDEFSSTTMAVPTKITTQVPNPRTTRFGEKQPTTEVESTTTHEFTFSETSSSVTKQTPPTRSTAKTPTGSPPTKSTMVPPTSQSSGPTMTPTPSPGTSPSQTPTAIPTTGSPSTRGDDTGIITITPPVNSPSGRTTESTMPSSASPGTSSPSTRTTEDVTITPPAISTSGSTGSSSTTTMAVPTKITTHVPDQRTSSEDEVKLTTEVERTTTQELTFSETSSSVTKQTPPTGSTAKTPTGSPPTKSTMVPPTSLSTEPTMTPTPSPGTSPSQTPTATPTTGSPSTRGEPEEVSTITPPVNSPSGRTTESTMPLTASPGTVSTEKPPFSSTSRTTGKPTSSPSTHNREDVTITPPAISTSGSTGSSSTTTMAVPTKITTQVPDQRPTQYDEVKLTSETEITTTQELTFSESSSSVTKQTPPTKSTEHLASSPPTRTTQKPPFSQPTGTTMQPTFSPPTQTFTPSLPTAEPKSSTEAATTTPVITSTTGIPCDIPMGVTNPFIISGEQLTATSSFDYRFEAERVRLNNQPTGDLAGAWMPRTNNRQQWVQVDFLSPQSITGVITQGRPEMPQWVTSFVVEISRDGITFNPIVDQVSGEPIQFTGNSDQNTPRINFFPVELSARIVRIHPLDWHSSIALRFDVLSCTGPAVSASSTSTPTITPTAGAPTISSTIKEITTTTATTTTTTGTTQFTTREMCTDLMGLENALIVHDSQMTESSVRDLSSGARNARIPNTISAWVPGTMDNNQWILVDLEKPKELTGIITTGSPVEDNWITEYVILTSIDGFSFTPYSEVMGGQTQYFTANSDRNTPQMNLFNRDVIARFVKIIPTRWSTDGIGLRFNLIGCYDELVTLVTPTSGSPSTQDDDSGISTITPAVSSPSGRTTESTMPSTASPGTVSTEKPPFSSTSRTTGKPTSSPSTRNREDVTITPSERTTTMAVPTKITTQVPDQRTTSRDEVKLTTEAEITTTQEVTFSETSSSVTKQTPPTRSTAKTPTGSPPTKSTMAPPTSSSSGPTMTPSPTPGTGPSRTPTATPTTGSPSTQEDDSRISTITPPVSSPSGRTTESTVPSTASPGTISTEKPPFSTTSGTSTRTREDVTITPPAISTSGSTGSSSTTTMAVPTKITTQVPDQRSTEYEEVKLTTEVERTTTQEVTFSETSSSVTKQTPPAKSTTKTPTESPPTKSTMAPSTSSSSGSTMTPTPSPGTSPSQTPTAIPTTGSPSTQDDDSGISTITPPVNSPSASPGTVSTEKPPFSSTSRTTGKPTSSPSTHNREDVTITPPAVSTSGSTGSSSTTTMAVPTKITTQVPDRGSSSTGPSITSTASPPTVSTITPTTSPSIGTRQTPTGSPSTTVSAYTCLESQWSPMINRNHPSTDITGGDHEVASREELDKFCVGGRITNIRCTRVDGIEHFSTGEAGLVCDVSSGFRCQNEVNLPIPCGDFRIQYYCECEATSTATSPTTKSSPTATATPSVPQSSTTPEISTSVTPSMTSPIAAQCVRSYWLEWVNRDIPDIGGVEHEYMSAEELRRLCVGGRINKIQCMTTDTQQPSQMTGEVNTCTVENGLICRAGDNNGQACYDYTVRYYCDCDATTQTPTPSLASVPTITPSATPSTEPSQTSTATPGTASPQTRGHDNVSTITSPVSSPSGRTTESTTSSTATPGTVSTEKPPFSSISRTTAKPTSSPSTHNREDVTITPPAISTSGSTGSSSTTTMAVPTKITTQVPDKQTTEYDEVKLTTEVEITTTQELTFSESSSSVTKQTPPTKSTAKTPTGSPPTKSTMVPPTSQSSGPTMTPTPSPGTSPSQTPTAIPTTGSPSTRGDDTGIITITPPVNSPSGRTTTMAVPTKITTRVPDKQTTSRDEVKLTTEVESTTTQELTFSETSSSVTKQTPPTKPTAKTPTGSPPTKSTMVPPTSQSSGPTMTPTPSPGTSPSQTPTAIPTTGSPSTRGDDTGIITITPPVNSPSGRTTESTMTSTASPGTVSTEKPPFSTTTGTTAKPTSSPSTQNREDVTITPPAISTSGSTGRSSTTTMAVPTKITTQVPDKQTTEYEEVKLTTEVESTTTQEVTFSETSSSVTKQTPPTRSTAKTPTGSPPTKSTMAPPTSQSSGPTTTPTPSPGTGPSQTPTATPTTGGPSTRGDDTGISTITTPVSSPTGITGSSSPPTVPSLISVKCAWSPWLNTDNPIQQGDFETIRSLRTIYGVCRQIADIECRVAGTAILSSAAGQSRVSCDINNGLRCYNAEQRNHRCLDYEVRVLCWDTTCEPTPTPSVPVTSPELETTTAICLPGQVWETCSYHCRDLCHSMLGEHIERGVCTEGEPERCVAGCSHPSCVAGQLIIDIHGTCVKEEMCTCLKPDGTVAKPYERWPDVTDICTTCSCIDNHVTCTRDAYCTSSVTPTPSTHITSTTTEPLVSKTTPKMTVHPDCYWTMWINTGRPDGPDGGDLETLERIRTTNVFCENPIRIDCRDVRNQESADEVGQIVTCDVNTGLTCFNRNNVENCVDYEVRFYCPCTEPSTTATPPTGPASTATPGTVSTITPRYSHSSGPTMTPTGSPPTRGDDSVISTITRPVSSPSGKTTETTMPSTASPGTVSTEKPPFSTTTRTTAKPTSSPSTRTREDVTITPPAISTSGSTGSSSTSAMAVPTKITTQVPDKQTTSRDEVKLTTEVESTTTQELTFSETSSSVTKQTPPTRSTAKTPTGSPPTKSTMAPPTSQSSGPTMTPTPSPGTSPSQTPTAIPTTGSPSTRGDDTGIITITPPVNSPSGGTTESTMPSTASPGTVSTEKPPFSSTSRTTGKPTSSPSTRTREDVTITPPAISTSGSTGSSSTTTMAVPTQITTQIPDKQTTEYDEVKLTTEVESTTTQELTFSETSSSGTKQTPPTRSSAKTPTGSPPTKSTMAPPTSQSSGPTMTPTPSPGTSPSQTPSAIPTTGSPSTRGDDTGIITITPPVNSPSGRTTESTMPSTASPGTVSTEKPPFSSTSRTTGKPTSSPSTRTREDVTITPPAISTSGSTGGSSTTTMAVPTKITTQVPDKQTTEYDEVKLTTEVESTTTQELTFSETSSSVTKQTPPTRSTAKTPTGSPPTKSTMTPPTSLSTEPTMTPHISIVTTTPKVTCGWSGWFNTHSPDANGEVEFIQTIRRTTSSEFCAAEDITAIRCRVAGTSLSYVMAGQSGIVCDLKYNGLMCVNNRQPEGQQCMDYEIQVLCEPDGMICDFTTPTPTPVTSSPTPSIQTSPSSTSARTSLMTISSCTESHWTPWINRNHPTNAVTSGDREFATTEELNTYCVGGKITRISCVRDGHISHLSSGEFGLICDVTTGLTCSNEANQPIKCSDFSIRYYCECEDTVTTARPSTTEVPTISVPVGSSTTQVPTISVPVGSSTTQVPTISVPVGSSTTQVPTISVPVGSSTTQVLTISVPVGSSTTQVPTISVPVGSSTTQVPTISVPVGSSTTQVPTISVPVGSSTTQVPTISVPVGRSTTQVPTISVPVGSSTTQVPTISVPVGSSTTQVPTISVPVGSSTKQVPTISVPVGSSTTQAPTISVPVGSSTTQVPTISVPVGSSTTQVPTISVPVGSSTTQVPTISVPVGSSTTQVPTISVPVGSSTTQVPTISVPVGSSTKQVPTISVPVGSSTTQAPTISVPVGGSTTEVPTISMPVGGSTTVVPPISTPIAVSTTETACLEPMVGAQPDTIITAFTTFSDYTTALRSRINTTREGPWEGGWIAANSNTQQWIEVDFERPIMVTGISTQGVNGQNIHVTSYVIMYSVDGVNYTPYQEITGITRVFQGNNDSNTVVQYILQPITARFVRLQPRTWFGGVGLRWEVFGCAEPSLTTESTMPSTATPGTVSTKKPPFSSTSRTTGKPTSSPSTRTWEDVTITPPAISTSGSTGSSSTTTMAVPTKITTQVPDQRTTEYDEVKLTTEVESTTTQELTFSETSSSVTKQTPPTRSSAKTPTGSPPTKSTMAPQTSSSSRPTMTPTPSPGTSPSQTPTATPTTGSPSTRGDDTGIITITPPVNSPSGRTTESTMPSSASPGTLSTEKPPFSSTSRTTGKPTSSPSTRTREDVTITPPAISTSGSTGSSSTTTMAVPTKITTQVPDKQTTSRDEVKLTTEVESTTTQELTFSETSSSVTKQTPPTRSTAKTPTGSPPTKSTMAPPTSSSSSPTMTPTPSPGTSPSQTPTATPTTGSPPTRGDDTGIITITPPVSSPSGRTTESTMPSSASPGTLSTEKPPFSSTSRTTGKPTSSPSTHNSEDVTITPPAISTSGGTGSSSTTTMAVPTKITTLVPDQRTTEYDEVKLTTEVESTTTQELTFSETSSSVTKQTPPTRSSAKTPTGSPPTKSTMAPPTGSSSRPTMTPTHSPGTSPSQTPTAIPTTGSPSTRGDDSGIITITPPVNSPSATTKKPPIVTPTSLPNNCTDEMGMVNRLITDQMLSGTEPRTPSFDVTQARLNGPSAWIPATDDTSQYVQVDFLEPHILTGVTTQGRPGIPNYVTSYTVQFSYDGFTWNPLYEVSGVIKVFTANSDSETPVTNWFLRPIRTRYIRIIPQSRHNQIALRFDVIGCFEPYPTESTPSTRVSTVTVTTPDTHVRVTPIVTTITDSCIEYGPWVNFGEPDPLTGDYEPIDQVREASVVCAEPMQIECRLAGPARTDYRRTGQKVKCNLWDGLVCNNGDQMKEPFCFDYEVRVGCVRNIPECLPTPTPSVSVPTPIVPCYEGLDISNCPREGCARGLYCNGMTCVRKSECPCIIDGRVVRADFFTVNSICESCQCVNGQSSCRPKQCPACVEGFAMHLDYNTCQCSCETCAVGEFMCSTGECLPRNLTCDGVVDCSNDEIDCPTPTPVTPTPSTSRTRTPPISTPAINNVTSLIITPSPTSSLPTVSPTIITPCADVVCKPLVMPTLRRGEVAQLIRGVNECCEEYIVICRPELCYTSNIACVKPMTLHRINIRECCAQFECVCPSTCPTPVTPNCAVGSSVIEIAIDCNCTEYACVVSTPTPVTVIPTGSTTPTSVIITPAPGICRYVTRQGETRMYKPGETWTDGLCKSCTCSNVTVGIAEIDCQEQTCSSCRQGERLVQRPGQCCGECRQAACLVNGRVYQANEIIAGGDICFEQTCVYLPSSNIYLIQKTSIQCPRIEQLPLCQPGQAMYDGCCPQCVNATIITNDTMSGICQTCSPRLVFGDPNKSLGFFRVTNGGVVCVNKVIVPDLRECSGFCDSVSRYRNMMTGFTNDCNCCQPSTQLTKSVKLSCTDGRTIIRNYLTPTACGCSPCTGGR